MSFALLLRMRSLFFCIFHLKLLSIRFSMHQLLKSFIYLLILNGQLFYKSLEKSDPLLRYYLYLILIWQIFFLIIHIETQLLGAYTSVMVISSWWIGLFIISKFFPFVFGNDFCFEGYFFWFSLIFSGNIFVQFIIFLTLNLSVIFKFKMLFLRQN